MTDPWGEAEASTRPRVLDLTPTSLRAKSARSQFSRERGQECGAGEGWGRPGGCAPQAVVGSGKGVSCLEQQRGWRQLLSPSSPQGPVLLGPEGLQAAGEPLSSPVSPVIPD